MVNWLLGLLFGLYLACSIRQRALDLLSEDIFEIVFSLYIHFFIADSRRSSFSNREADDVCLHVLQVQVTEFSNY